MTGGFVCPIYEKGRDFEYGYELAESAARHGVLGDLWFVFSSGGQRERFLEECLRRLGRAPRALVAPEGLSACANPVTVKKFYALRQLAADYDYLAAIDCECVFVRDIRAGELLDAVWREGTFLAANRSRRGGGDVRRCARALGLERNRILRRETDHFRYTWWFNEIPVYRGQDCGDFFGWIDRNGYGDVICRNWYCFDYLVYGMWLLLYRDLHLRRYPRRSHTGLIESLWKPEVPRKREAERRMGTHWTSRIRLDPKESPRICLQFHRDRRQLGVRHLLGRIRREARGALPGGREGRAR